MLPLMQWHVLSLMSDAVSRLSASEGQYPPFLWLALTSERCGCIAQDFDLSLACALGACSFEAYHVAYHMHGLKVPALFPEIIKEHCLP